MKQLTTSDINDLAYWARRYADGRSTYVTREVNEIIDKMIKNGIQVTKDESLKDPEGLYASDAMFGLWRNGKFEKQANV